jgi:hypothetical protein
MFDFASAIESVANLGTTITKAIAGDAGEEANAKKIVIEAQVAAVVSELKATQAVMLAEAASSDPWTSRARPSFMYVVYVLLLSAIPMGIVFAVSPAVAENVTTGFKNWLSAIPGPVIDLFGYGYIGYTGARSLEKIKGASK